jgi:predicted MFS family arabinose efflux permease
MAVSETPTGLLASSGVLMGFGLAGTTFGVILGVVARHVPVEKRSAALGLTAAGGSVGQFVMLPVAQGLIGTFQWQAALFMMAAIAALMVPLAAGMTGRASPQDGPAQSIGEALGEVARHRTFHYLFWSYFTCGFHTAFITLHLPQYVLDIGMPVTVGVTAVALIGLFNAFGTYYAGVLGGRHSKKGLLAWIYLLRAVVILAFLLGPKTRSPRRSVSCGSAPCRSPTAWSRRSTACATFPCFPAWCSSATSSAASWARGWAAISPTPPGRTTWCGGSRWRSA